MTTFPAKMISPFHPLVRKSYYDVIEKLLCAFIYNTTEISTHPDGEITPPHDLYKKYFRVCGKWKNENQYKNEPFNETRWGIAGVEDQLKRGIIILIEDKDRWELIDVIT